MKTNEHLLREMEDLRNRLRETEETLHDLQYREEILRKSEQEKTAILNSLSEEVTYLDMDMKVLWTNRTANESAGMAPEQIVGRHCYDVWCQSGEPRIDCPAARTIKTGQREQGEISIPDGRTLLHRSYPTRGAKGNITGTVVITLNITERKQAEKVLRESENAYRTLAENLPGMVYRVFIRENNRMEFFNKMLQPTTGYTAEELIAGELCSIEPFILSEDQPTVVATVKCAIQNNQPFEVEYRLRNKGGETRYFLERGRPIYGPDEKPLYIDGVIFDITHRKMAEEKLRRSEQEKGVILNATMESMGIVDTSLRIVWANKVCADRASLPLDQVPGHYCYEIWAKRSEPCVGCPTLKTIETGGPEEAEISSSDGRIWLHRSYPVQNTSGHIEGIVATAIDITERRQMEEELRRSHEELEKRVEERTKELREEIVQRKETQQALQESENRFALFMQHLPGSAFIKDSEGRILYVNEYVEKTYNCNIGDFLDKTGQDFWPPDLAAKIREDDDYVISTGRTIERIEEIEHGGKWIPFLTFKFPIFRPGLPPLLGGISIDVTERKRAEEALRESEKRLRFLSSQLITVQEQERKRIAGQLHEGLAALLSGIKYKVEVALQQKARNKLKAVEKELESVIPMIQESVEEVRRIQTDLRPATLDSLGVLATIRSFCRRFQTIYPSISIQQQIDIGEGEIPASLKIVIYRISQEALNNVAKHSKGDLVHLFVGKREEKIELVIQDNGRGFDVNEALSRESAAQGLGLTSMRERAELSGGSFTIESIAGKGTTIRASWPCI